MGFSSQNMKSVRNKVYTMVDCRAYDKIQDQVDIKIKNEVSIQIVLEVRNQVWTRVGNQILNLQIYNHLYWGCQQPLA